MASRLAEPHPWPSLRVDDSWGLTTELPVLNVAEPEGSLPRAGRRMNAPSFTTTTEPRLEQNLGLSMATHLNPSLGPVSLSVGADRYAQPATQYGSMCAQNPLQRFTK